MFAKLKKKIEEEVGDLGQLTSPLSNTFGGGDRRVSSAGGSSQGTNTPNNLGSRQSSMASLVDLHPIDENQPVTTTPTSKNAPNSFGHHLSPQSPVTPNSGPPGARSTSNYIASVQQKAMENFEAELKRVNADWGKKLDALKKTYEEKLQNQEADFAWKYSTKEDEIEKLKVEKRKLEEAVKNVEGIYQSKITRAHDDIDQLEGYTKQEMAKVKHLLLNAQADLQQVQGELFQSDIKVKDLTEENQNLKSENENLLKNLNKLEFGTGKTVKTLEEQLEELRNKTTSLESELNEKNIRLDSLSEINQNLQSKHDTLAEELKQAKTAVDSKTLENEEMLRTVSNENASLEQEAQAYRNELKELKEKFATFTAASESSSKDNDSDIKRALAELQNVCFEKSMLEKTLDDVKVQFEADLRASNKEVHNLKTKIAALESELPSKEELTNCQILLARVQEDLAQKEDKLSEFSLSNEKLKSENENLMKNLSELAGSEEIVKNLQNQVNEFKDRITSLEAETKEKTQELMNMRATNESLNVKNESLLREVNDVKLTFENDLKQSSAEVAELRQQFSAQSSEHELREKTEEQLKEALNQIKAISAHNQTLQQSLAGSLTKMEEDTSAKTHELNELRSKLASLEADIPSKDELAQAQANLRQTQENAKQLEERVKNLINENQQLKSKNEDFVKRAKQANASKEENLKQLRAELENLRKKERTLENEASKKEKEFVNLSEQIQNLRSQNEESLKKLNEITSKYEAEKAKNDEVLMKLNSEYTKTEVEHAKTDALLKELESEKAKCKQEKEKHDAVVKELNDERNKFEGLKSNNEAQLEKVNQQKAELESENATHIAELKELREKLAQVSSDAKSRDEYEDELKLALDEIEKLNIENDSLQKSLTDQNTKFDAETRANNFELNVLREKLSMFETDAHTKEENGGELKGAVEELRNLKAENDMLSKSLREEKAKFRKQMKDHASAINELKGKMMVEPAVIQSSNSHHTEASNNYTEDVNFQYMRSVLFKFITTSDPQVTKHLTKAVATLLHLNDEEGRLLQKSTDKRIKSWFPGGGEHLS